MDERSCFDDDTQRNSEVQNSKPQLFSETKISANNVSTDTRLPFTQSLHNLISTQRNASSSDHRTTSPSHTQQSNLQPHVFGSDPQHTILPLPFQCIQSYSKGESLPDSTLPKKTIPHSPSTSALRNVRNSWNFSPKLESQQESNTVSLPPLLRPNQWRSNRSKSLTMLSMGRGKHFKDRNDNQQSDNSGNNLESESRSHRSMSTTAAHKDITAIVQQKRLDLSEMLIKDYQQDTSDSTPSDIVGVHFFSCNHRELDDLDDASSLMSDISPSHLDSSSSCESDVTATCSSSFTQEKSQVIGINAVHSNQTGHGPGSNNFKSGADAFTPSPSSMSLSLLKTHSYPTLSPQRRYIRPRRHEKPPQPKQENLSFQVNGSLARRRQRSSRLKYGRTTGELLSSQIKGDTVQHQRSHKDEIESSASHHHQMSESSRSQQEMNVLKMEDTDATGNFDSDKDSVCKNTAGFVDKLSQITDTKSLQHRGQNTMVDDHIAHLNPNTTVNSCNIKSIGDMDDECDLAQVVELAKQQLALDDADSPSPSSIQSPRASPIITRKLKNLIKIDPRHKHKRIAAIQQEGYNSSTTVDEDDSCTTQRRRRERRRSSVAEVIGRWSKVHQVSLTRTIDQLSKQSKKAQELESSASHFDNSKNGISLKNFMSMSEKPPQMPSKLRIQVITWNMNEQDIPASVEQLLRQNTWGDKEFSSETIPSTDNKEVSGNSFNSKFSNNNIHPNFQKYDLTQHCDAQALSEPDHIQIHHSTDRNHMYNNDFKVQQKHTGHVQALVSKADIEDIPNAQFTSFDLINNQKVASRYNASSNTASKSASQDCTYPHPANFDATCQSTCTAHKFADGCDIDLYVVATQEGTMARKGWKVKLQEELGLDYVLLHSHFLMGIHMCVFVHRRLLWFIDSVLSSHVATKLGGMLRTKGAVGITVNFRNFSLLFIDSHLAAHRSNLRERNENYNTIRRTLNLSPPESSTASEM